MKAQSLRPLLIRLAYTIPVIWLVVSLVFLLIHLVPGDPVQQMLGEGAAPGDIAALRHSYGLDVPLGQQYLHYWHGVTRGDFGHSIRLNDTVAHLVTTRYPYTLELTIAALLVALAAAVPAGVTAALHRGQWQDRAIGFVSLLGLSFPALALGPIMQLLVSIKLGWLPVSGAGDSTPAPLAAASHGFGSLILALPHLSLPNLILPALTMGGALAAVLTRMVRTAMLEELNQDYIRTTCAYYDCCLTYFLRVRERAMFDRKSTACPVCSNSIVVSLPVFRLDFRCPQCDAMLKISPLYMRVLGLFSFLVGYAIAWEVGAHGQQNASASRRCFTFLVCPWDFRLCGWRFGSLHFW